METQRLLELCQYYGYEPGQLVYTAGEPSDEMFIIQEGRLNVVGKLGTVLGEVLPGASTGEMGVLTGRVRSATVIAVELTKGYSLSKQDLDALFREDQGLCMKIMKNMVNLLCERLEAANVNIEGYAIRIII